MFNFFILITFISFSFQKIVYNYKNQNNIRKLASIDLEKIRKDILSSHNYHRGRHRVDDLKRNSEIEAIAQGYAEQLAPTHSINHSTNKYNGQSLGENLYMSSGSGINGEDATNSWYSEIENYDFSTHYSDGTTGHFTQLVWKGTKEIGCGVACDGTFCCVVCNYYPMGNFVGKYKYNVFPLKTGMSTVGIVFLVIFIILILAISGFAIYHFFYLKRDFNQLKDYIEYFKCCKK